MENVATILYDVELVKGLESKVRCWLHFHLKQFNNQTKIERNESSDAMKFHSARV